MASNETFNNGAPDAGPDNQPECPECGGTGEVFDGIYGKCRQTCPRCNGSGIENCEYNEGD